MSDDLKYNLHRIQPGSSRSEALDVFLSACNKPDTLFITDRWIAPRIESLTRLLTDPITQDQAEALVDAVMQKEKMDVVIGWLEYASETPWGEFTAQRAQMAAEMDAAIQEAQMRRHLAWLEELKARPRPACPKCGLDDEVVPIFYGLPARPVLPAYGAYVLGGCMLRFDKPWHCKRCAPNSRNLEDWASSASRWSGSF
jgi:hypothetical protein